MMTTMEGIWNQLQGGVRLDETFVQRIFPCNDRRGSNHLVATWIKIFSLRNSSWVFFPVWKWGTAIGED